jgi:hypothetical protein
MNDPRRWTDDGGEATALERELVRAGRDPGPSHEQRRMMWGAIAAQAIPSATGQGAAPASGTAASTGLTIVKGTVIVALIGAGIVASYRTMRGPIPPITKPAASAPASAPARHEQAQLPSVSPAPGDDPSGEVLRSAKIAHSTPRPNAAATKEVVENARASQLREESEMILGARRVLRAGDPLRALTLLDAARARFPEGILVQEREALSIEALVRSGQRALATKRAEAFLHAFPKSPHGADVKRIVLEP